MPVMHPTQPEEVSHMNYYSYYHSESWTTGLGTRLVCYLYCTLTGVQFSHSTILISIGIPQTRSLPSLNIIQSYNFLLGIVLNKYNFILIANHEGHPCFMFFSYHNTTFIKLYHIKNMLLQKDTNLTTVVNGPYDDIISLIIHVPTSSATQLF